MLQDLPTRVPKYWIPHAAGSPRNLEKGVARYGNPEHAPAPWLPPTKGSPATRTPQPGERVRPDSKPLRRRPLDSPPPAPQATNPRDWTPSRGVLPLPARQAAATYRALCCQNARAIFRETRNAEPARSLRRRPRLTNRDARSALREPPSSRPRDRPGRHQHSPRGEFQSKSPRRERGLEA